MNGINQIYEKALIRFRSRLSKRELSEGLNYDYIHDAIESVMKHPERFDKSENKLSYVLGIARHIRSRRYNIDMSKSKPMYESFISSYSNYTPIKTEDGIELTDPEIALDNGDYGMFLSEDSIYDKIQLDDISRWMLSPDDSYIEFKTKSHGKSIIASKKVKQGKKEALLMSASGFSRDEISVKMGITLNEVKHLLISARKELTNRFV